MLHTIHQGENGYDIRRGVKADMISGTVWKGSEIMEIWKHKLGIAAALAGICVVLAVIWYCLFGWSERNMEKEGTLVYKTEAVMTV